MQQRKGIDMSEVIKGIGLCKENILYNVDFSMEKGEMVAIMGPSGSGKSTLLYQLSGMDSPDSGQVIFDEKDICKLSEDGRADERLSKMGFVFQQMNMLPNLNIIDNIILPAIEREKVCKGNRANKVNKVNKVNKADRKTESMIRTEAVSLMNKVGISGLEKRKITEVSGGQLQRACICRAIMNQPELLLADEPTGALNKGATREVMDILTMLNREGTSILLVTHDSQVASYCKRILYMSDGRIIGELTLGQQAGLPQKNREQQVKQWLEKLEW